VPHHRDADIHAIASFNLDLNAPVAHYSPGQGEVVRYDDNKVTPTTHTRKIKTTAALRYRTEPPGDPIARRRPPAFCNALHRAWPVNRLKIRWAGGLARRCLQCVAATQTDRARCIRLDQPSIGVAAASTLRRYDFLRLLFLDTSTNQRRR